MIRYESQCVFCGFPCRHEACRYYMVRVLECDYFREESDRLYIGLLGKELCAECALEELEVVE